MSSPISIPDRAKRVPARLSKSRAAVLALVALIAPAVISGCGSDPLPVGPLGVKQENPTKVGQPVRHGGADTIGFDAVYNSGSKPAIVDRLVIRSPRHIKLIGAYVTLGGVIGNWTTYPPVIPSSQADAFRWWANRHEVAGAVIPPHNWAGIALGLAATRAHGSIAGIDLFYHVGQTHYEWHGHIRMVLTSVARIPGN